MVLQVSKVAWTEVCLVVSYTIHDLYGLIVGFSANAVNSMAARVNNHKVLGLRLEGGSCYHSTLNNIGVNKKERD
jgi:hypothetical protein